MAKSNETKHVSPLILHSCKEKKEERYISQLNGGDDSQDFFWEDTAVIAVELRSFRELLCHVSHTARIPVNRKME